MTLVNIYVVIQFDSLSVSRSGRDLTPTGIYGGCASKEAKTSGL